MIRESAASSRPDVSPLLHVRAELRTGRRRLRAGAITRTSIRAFPEPKLASTTGA